MAENYLITGYWGEPHVTSENDRGINAAIFGAGRFVLPVGEQFRAEYIGNNTVRIYDGKLMDNGAVAGIPAGEYVDLLIPEAGQGMKRNDLIIFQYSQDTSTLIERGVFKVLSGTETSGTATDPALSQQDLLTNEATLDQMALWRVPVSGTVISTPVQLFDVSKNIKNAGVSVVEATSSDGVAYSATVPGVTELYSGLEITIIPQMESTSETITLDVNGLGAKNVRLPLSSNTTTLVMPAQPNYYTVGRPVKMRYDSKWINKGAWVVAERQRTSANDLYGTVPVENGGTGADNAEEARENLGAAPSGYGLGNKDEVPNIIDWGTLGVATQPGWYKVAFDSWYTGESILRVDAMGNQIVQTFMQFDKDILQICRRARAWNSDWCDLEWDNPPMLPGVVYRTTKRHNGKPVYVLYTGDKGGLSANNLTSFNCYDSGVIDEIVSCNGNVWKDGQPKYSFPLIYGNGANQFVICGASANGVVNVLSPGGAMSSYNHCSFTIEFTKLADG